VTRARTDEGFTLIELVMAVTVLALAIFGLAAVFGASIRTGAVDVHRTNAVALATQWSERLRAVPYEHLGLADGDTSSACDNGASIVVVDQPGVTVADALPTIMGGVAFTVDRCVVWTSDSNLVATTAYKRSTVTVSWTDEAGPHLVRQDAAAYPGGLGPATSTSTTLVTCGGPPDPAASVGVSLPTPVTAELDWSTPAGSPTPIDAWLVEYSADGWVTTNVVTDRLIAAPAGTSNEDTVGGLASNTNYAFRVVALPSPACPVGGSSPTEATVTTGTDSGGGPSCAAGLATVSPPVVARDLGSSDIGSLALTVAVAGNGHCSALVVAYQATAATGVETTSLSKITGDHWQAQVPASTEVWDLGLHTLTISEGGVPVAQVTVCVVNAGATAC
jgi:hypothetical protein